MSSQSPMVPLPHKVAWLSCERYTKEYLRRLSTISLYGRGRPKGAAVYGRRVTKVNAQKLKLGKEIC